MSALQQRMRQKLEGAQFRMINETLYTSESKAALDKFSKEPELFDVVSVNEAGMMDGGIMGYCSCAFTVRGHSVAVVICWW